jgi:hypothetical protein
MRRSHLSGALGLVAVAASLTAGGCGSDSSSVNASNAAVTTARLPQSEIQDALGAKGSITDGVLAVSVDRTTSRT